MRTQAIFTLICTALCVAVVCQFCSTAVRIGALESEIDYLKTVVIEMQADNIHSSHKSDIREAGMSIEAVLINGVSNE